MTGAKAQPQKTHLELGDAFFDSVKPAEFPDLILRFRNDRAARLIGIDGLSDKEWEMHFGRFRPFKNSLPCPYALRYHGHQFGHYNPDLGDGRGFLFAQFIEFETGRLIDLGTKGSGQTPYSRTADGKLTLKGAVREILATEMLDARGVPTSHTLSVFETGEELIRNDEPSPTRSAVLVRQLHSHIRIGSFQRLAYLGQTDNLERLLRFCARYYYAELDADQDYPQLIINMITCLRQKMAKMVAGWMAAGFVHGVLNTDNFNITAESFDYGPWRFLPTFQPGFTAAYFDNTSRYAYGRQPQAALWALCRLADCFVDVVSAEDLTLVLSNFYTELERDVASHICWRLGLTGKDSDKAEVTEMLFKAAAHSQISWDRLFTDAYGGNIDSASCDPLWASDSNLIDLAQRLTVLDRRQSDNAVAAVRQVPPVSLEHENMEALWAPIADSDDWSALYQAIEHIRMLKDALRAD